MSSLDNLAEILNSQGSFTSIVKACGDLSVECELSALKSSMYWLRDHDSLVFDQLIDLCAVDYLHYGKSEWETEDASLDGFSRGVSPQKTVASWDKPRFAVVYHLLSSSKNHRVRLKIFLEESNLIVPSVCDIWKVANWFEREAYDLFGILFDGHPDLRRILTDYGFIGHPFRKDFPLSGDVEMRYDASLKQVIYEPVDIVPRTLVPKVIRANLAVASRTIIESES